MQSSFCSSSKSHRRIKAKVAAEITSALRENIGNGNALMIFSKEYFEKVAKADVEKYMDASKKLDSDNNIVDARTNDLQNLKERAYGQLSSWIEMVHYFFLDELLPWLREREPDYLQNCCLQSQIQFIQALSKSDVILDMKSTAKQLNITLKDLVHRQKSYKSAAGILLSEDKSEVLLVYSKPKRCWTLPQGKVEFDEDCFEAVKEEVKEEALVTIHADVQEDSDCRSFPLSLSRHKTITCYIFQRSEYRGPTFIGKRADGDKEISEIKWFKIPSKLKLMQSNEFLEKSNKINHSKDIKEQEKRALIRSLESKYNEQIITFALPSKVLLEYMNLNERQVRSPSLASISSTSTALSYEAKNCA